MITKRPPSLAAIADLPRAGRFLLLRLRGIDAPLLAKWRCRAAAFVLGVEFVNDSAITILGTIERANQVIVVIEDDDMPDIEDLQPLLP